MACSVPGTVTATSAGVLGDRDFTEASYEILVNRIGLGATAVEGVSWGR